MVKLFALGVSFIRLVEDVGGRIGNWTDWPEQNGNVIRPVFGAEEL